MKAGDVITVQRENGEWACTRILVVDTWEDGTETFHCLCYKPTAEKPTEASVDSLDVAVFHAPIAGESFKATWQVLCSRPVTEAHLVGFVEYLRMTNFPRYIEFTKQDIDAIVARAHAHYKKAYALGEEGKKLESIKEYANAIDEFPMFYEAIDNLAFTYMELGNYSAALAEFKNSLRVNPDGNAAFFSRGECLLKLGRFDEAEKVFLEGAHRFRDHQTDYLRYLEITRLSRRQLATASNDAPISPNTQANPPPTAQERPWWKFWI